MSGNIAKNIKKRLIDLGKNEIWLAEQLGTTRSNVYGLIKNLKEGKGANTKNLEKIANILEVEVYELLK